MTVRTHRVRTWCAVGVISLMPALTMTASCGSPTGASSGSAAVAPAPTARNDQDEQGGQPAPGAAEQVQTPDWVLSSFPVPTGSKYRSNHPNGHGNLVLRFEPGTDPDAVVAFYRTYLPSTGYAVEETSLSLSFTDDEVEGEIVPIADPKPDASPVGVVVKPK